MFFCVGPFLGGELCSLVMWFISLPCWAVCSEDWRLTGRAVPFSRRGLLPASCSVVWDSAVCLHGAPGSPGTAFPLRRAGPVCAFLKAWAWLCGDPHRACQRAAKWRQSGSSSPWPGLLCLWAGGGQLPVAEGSRAARGSHRSTFSLLRRRKCCWEGWAWREVEDDVSRLRKLW